MDRIGIRLSAAILAATTTFAVLSAIGSLAEFESSHDLTLVVMPAVVVTATRSEQLVDACGAESEPNSCTTQER